MAATTKRFRMDGEGRIQVPEEMRQTLHLHPDAELEMGIVGDRIELTPVSGTEAVVRRKGKLLVVSQTGKPFDAVEALAAIREERR
jgi:bifunctional DNA-binding transcriptional regulator/antitoxin component of YhaV-PrlF toxin-antitoxin module